MANPIYNIKQYIIFLKTEITGVTQDTWKGIHPLSGFPNSQSTALAAVPGSTMRGRHQLTLSSAVQDGNIFLKPQKFRRSVSKVCQISLLCCSMLLYFAFFLSLESFKKFLFILLWFTVVFEGKGLPDRNTSHFYYILVIG